MRKKLLRLSGRTEASAPGNEDGGAQFLMRGLSQLARTDAQVRKGQNE